MDTIYIPLDQFLQNNWPRFVPQPEDLSSLRSLYIQPLEHHDRGDLPGIISSIVVRQNIVFNLPGIDRIKAVLKPTPSDSQTPISIGTNPRLIVNVGEIGIALRFDDDLLIPVRRVESRNGFADYERDLSREYVQLDVGNISFALDSTEGIVVDGGIRAVIDKPLMIAATGIIIEEATVLIDIFGNDTNCLLSICSI